MATTTGKRRAVGIDTKSFTAAHWLTVGLATVSGVIHLWLFMSEDYTPFLLAGLGFFGAVVLLAVLPGYRQYLYPVGVVFVLAQIVGYVQFGQAFATPLWVDVLDKAAQVVLVGILSWLTYRAWT